MRDEEMSKYYTGLNLKNFRIDCINSKIASSRRLEVLYGICKTGTTILSTINITQYYMDNKKNVSDLALGFAYLGCAILFEFAREHRNDLKYKYMDDLRVKKLADPREEMNNRF